MRIAKSALEIFLVPVIVFVALWFITASSTTVFFPPLEKVIEQFGTVWTGDRLMQDVLPSILRLLAGYLLACVIGVALGLLLGLSWRAGAAAEPVLEFFRAVPPPVLVPVLILLLGFGDAMKIWVIVAGAIWPILLNTVDGVRSYDEVLGETVKVYQFTWWGRLTRMVLPGAMPRIFAGARQGLSIAIILMVISEMFAAENGLGAAIILFQRSFAVPQMWSGVLLLGILGFLLSMIFEFIERRALAWYRESRQIAEG
ncbi:ABC transporter permease [Microbacterium sp.]|uniref:ABC transporter permease n=1 Tax=Microbacterium sp. TaxID=51671 RepID=UPI002C9ECA13|nr:ABC transporter permease subunit [Microbacterium sp.]HWK76277.1 ABC transporter permease subunit [Microbacterium sp.]